MKIKLQVLFLFYCRIKFLPWNLFRIPFHILQIVVQILALDYVNQISKADPFTANESKTLVQYENYNKKENRSDQEFCTLNSWTFCVEMNLNIYEYEWYSYSDIMVFRSEKVTYLWYLLETNSGRINQK